jgi:hypothetical protein
MLARMSVNYWPFLVAKDSLLALFSLLLCCSIDARALAQTSSQPAQLSLGVEAITDTSDDTSDCFDFVQYLKQHPIKIAGTDVEVRLVDRPQDADYSISGDVDTTYRLDWQHDSGLYSYQWTESTRLRLRKSGSQAQELDAASSGSSSNSDPIVDFRHLILQDLWTKIEAEIASRMAQDLGKDAR